MAGCLSHVRVLDLSRVFAGPWAGQMLADFGADVIKVEHPVHGDDVRRMGVAHTDAQGRDTGETSSYLAMNRGKRSITIDISKPSGQALVKRLADKSDVLIENFKTGNLARYGLDHTALRTSHPHLVYCSITGFGQSGPYGDLPGYDPIFQAMSGVMSVTGVPDGQPGAGPSLVGYSVSDITAGYYAAIAILAALNHRDRVSGQGQHIDLALLDAQIHAVSHVAMNYLVSRKVPVRAGAASQITCPWQAFDCADVPLMLAVGNDQQFARLCETLGRPEPLRRCALRHQSQAHGEQGRTRSDAGGALPDTHRARMDGGLRGSRRRQRPDQRFRARLRRPAGPAPPDAQRAAAPDLRNGSDGRQSGTALRNPGGISAVAAAARRAHH